MHSRLVIATTEVVLDMSDDSDDLMNALTCSTDGIAERVFASDVLLGHFINRLIHNVSCLVEKENSGLKSVLVLHWLRPMPAVPLSQY